MRFRLRTLLILLAVLPPIVAVTAPPLLKWLTQKPLPPPAAAVAPPTNRNPYSVVYSTTQADPALAANVVKQLLSGSPNVSVELDNTTGKLSVLAPRSAHKIVEAILAELERNSP
jgi:hypothetical protein